MADHVRSLLANLAASFLLVVAFLMLALVAVALFMAWRGVPRVQLALRSAVPQLQESMRRFESESRAMVLAVLEPQIRIASRIVGVRAGVRALFGRHAR